MKPSKVFISMIKELMSICHLVKDVAFKRLQIRKLNVCSRNYFLIEKARSPVVLLTGGRDGRSGKAGLSNHDDRDSQSA